MGITWAHLFQHMGQSNAKSNSGNSRDRNRGGNTSGLRRSHLAQYHFRGCHRRYLETGNGSFAVVVGPIALGTYDLEFSAMDGTDCRLIRSGACRLIDFQSPGPTFGDATTITIPWAPE